MAWIHDALNEKDVQKKDLERRLNELEVSCKVKEFSAEELARLFKQAREMPKSGKLSTIRVLIERYVKQITINSEDIEIELNLIVNDRVLTCTVDNKKRRV